MAESTPTSSEASNAEDFGYVRATAAGFLQPSGRPQDFFQPWKIDDGVSSTGFSLQYRQLILVRVLDSPPGSEDFVCHLDNHVE